MAIEKEKEMDFLLTVIPVEYIEKIIDNCIEKSAEETDEVKQEQYRMMIIVFSELINDYRKKVKEAYGLRSA